MISHLLKNPLKFKSDDFIEQNKIWNVTFQGLSISFIYSEKSNHPQPPNTPLKKKQKNKQTNKQTKMCLTQDSFQRQENLVLQKHSCYKGTKVALSGLRQFLPNESPLKMMKNAFYFTVKALFVLKIF